MTSATPVHDKSTWGDGPWQQEPDRLEFQHAGLPCLCNRNNLGAWCGYVAVPPGHPLWAVGYNTESPVLAPIRDALLTQPSEDVELTFPRCLGLLSGELGATPATVLDCHGGITYASGCSGVICHTPLPGEPDNVWWFGFDCGHAGDLVPGMQEFYRKLEFKHIIGGAYRDLEFVRTQTMHLAEQLQALGAHHGSK